MNKDLAEPLDNINTVVKRLHTSKAKQRAAINLPKLECKTNQRRQSKTINTGTFHRRHLVKPC